MSLLLEDKEIIDITPVISEDIAVFPGDTSFERKVLMSFENKDHLGLSYLKSTVHLGAHADASNHYHKDGEGIEKRQLYHYIGGCQVIKVQINRNERIRPEHIKNKEITQKRILFCTNSFPNPNQWNEDFNSLSSDLIEYLAERRVFTVGIDTPSVDPATDKILESHRAIYKNNFAILEGLVLNHVKEGEYQLIALPLPIKGADASPVRAILLKESL